jgi:prophage regulatory protein
VAARATRKPQPIEAAQDPAALLTIATISALVGLGRSSVFAKEVAGAFPRGIRLSARCTRLVAVDVRTWLEERAAAAK